MPNAPTFRDRLATGYAELSPQLRRAADYLSANAQETATRSLRQVAVAAGVAPPTLSRLARALGFASYEELRDLARSEIGRRRISFAERAHALQAGRGEGNLLVDQARAAIGNLETLVDETDPRRLEAAARLLAGAPRVCLLGALASAAFADYAGYIGSMAFPDWTVPLRGESSAGALAALGPGDVVLAISFRPAARRTVEAVRLARERGTTVVAITDGPGNPVAGLADIGFVAATESPHFFASYVAALVLSEMLVTMAVREAGASAEARIAEVEAAQRAFGERSAE